MQFTLLALAATVCAASVLAAPTPDNAGTVVKRGGPEVCTTNTDGTGETDEQTTKDCCAAVKQQSSFDEVQKICEPVGGPAGNSIDTGGMVQCCSSRGRGSKAV